MMKMIVVVLIVVCVSIIQTNANSHTATATVTHGNGYKLNKRNVRTKNINRNDVSIVSAAVGVSATSSPISYVTSLMSPKLLSSLSLVGLFTLWYAFNAGYNVYNAFVKKDFQFPYATSSVQLLVGVILYAIPLWLLGIRKVPNMNVDDVLKLLPIATLNAAGHCCAVVAMFQVGGGSFTHVIKASEPVVSVLLNLLINKDVPKPFTALSLLPITYGVAYASTLGNLNVATMSKELTTKAAIMAMCSNFAFALRSILRKNLPSDFKKRTNLDPANEHAVTTALSFLLTVPFVLYFESPTAIKNSISAMANKFDFGMNLGLCGMSFYLYNEMQNIVLSSLGPVPTAVGNTLKRVVIFVALYLFTQGETFPMPKVIGCAIAIAGCLGFSICDSQKI